MLVRDRDTKGTISLLFSLLLLFLTVAGSIPAGTAQADSQWGNANVTFSSNTTAKVSLTPLTTTSVNPLSDLEFLFSSSGGTSVGNQVYQAYLSTLSYSNGVYTAQVYNSSLAVYQFTLGLVYGGTVYDNGSGLLTVYLDDLKPIPISSGSGSSSSSTTPSGTTTATTTVENGQVNVDVSSSSLTTQASESSVSTVTITVNTTSAGTNAPVVASLPAAGLSAVGKAGKSVELQTASGTVVLPPSVVSQLASAAGTGSATVEITSSPTLSATVPSGYTTGGAVVSITLSAGGKNIEPNGKVQLVIPFDTSKVTGQNQYLLGLYRVNDDGSLTYVGGKVDSNSGTITADVDHLSTYAILAYQPNFADTQGNWAQDDITILAAHHVVNGTTATTFEPNGQVTRAEFAAMLVRLLGSASGTADYKDVASDAWYASAVGAAEAAGLVKGFPDGTFHPNDPITREQMAVLITRALGASAPSSTDIKSELQRFTDASMIDSWAQAGATTVVQQLIIQGLPGAVFGPRQDTTRAQSAAMLKRLMVSLGLL